MRSSAHGTRPVCVMTLLSDPRVQPVADRGSDYRKLLRVLFPLLCDAIIKLLRSFHGLGVHINALTYAVSSCVSVLSSLMLRTEETTLYSCREAEK
jgi:hypothetical protein